MTEDAISIGGVDLTDPDTFAKGMPYEAFRELRQRAPVAWHPFKDGPGFLALTGYDEVLAVSRDSTTWSSQETGVFYDIPLPEDAYQLTLMMLTMDPPRHTKLRSLVSKGFTPRQVARLNDHIADMSRQIVDDVMEQGECDFVEDIAGALPSYVIAELLGIPLEDGRRLYHLTEIMNTGTVGDPVPKTRRCRCSSTATSLRRANARIPATTSRPRCCSPKWTVSVSPTSSSTCSFCY
ncbi:MAG TPA: hypothetical protein VFC01_27130 [Mycobacterium sp.]|nr:hypothetical protein [Mycobacterium sp.]